MNKIFLSCLTLTAVISYSSFSIAESTKTMVGPERGQNWDNTGWGEDIIAIDDSVEELESLIALDYSRFALQTGTPLHETGDNFSFLVARNGDVFAINRNNTSSGFTELIILSASSNYQRFSLQTTTALPEVGDNWDFILAPNRDLVAIKKSKTGTQSTELHVLSQSSDYQSFVLHTATALRMTGDEYEFAMSSNRDLLVIKKNFTSSSATEVYTLSASSMYRSFSQIVTTALGITGDEFDFKIGPNNDIFAIKKFNTGSDSVEVYVLSALHGYKSFSLQTGTALPQIYDSFEFGLDSASNLYAIKKRGTGTNSTEIHKLYR